MRTSKATRPLKYAVVIGIGLLGVTGLCWGARAASVAGRAGTLPGVLAASAGVLLLVLAGYGYYVMDFRGKGGRRAFALRMTSAAMAGFFSMLLARVLFR